MQTETSPGVNVQGHLSNLFFSSSRASFLSGLGWMEDYHDTFSHSYKLETFPFYHHGTTDLVDFSSYLDRLHIYPYMLLLDCSTVRPYC